MKQDVLGIGKELQTAAGTFKYFSLKDLEDKGHKISKLPFSIRVLVENVIRNYDGFSFTDENIKTILGWKPDTTQQEIPYMPGRVLMQDFTGVPAVVDIASIRAEVARKGKNPDAINPIVQADLVIDHSVQVAHFGSADAYAKNVALEYQQNDERYKLLKWAQGAFANFSVVPPGLGICHQVNLEYLAKVSLTRDGYVFPDTLVGTDSHTPMVNGIGVVGWGVGGIEAEAVLLNQPIYMLMPQVIGLKLTGKLPEGATSTDLVLAITQRLREYGVVGKFVEVFGPGLDHLSVPDRATISNMSPEFGCTVTYFPVDDQTMDYMRKSARPDELVDLAEKYFKANMLWRDNEDAVEYTDVVEMDVSSIEPAMAGPKRPQDRVLLKNVAEASKKIIKEDFGKPQPLSAPVKYNGAEFDLKDGDVVIAAITSCTNTSNPSVMLGAGLVAKKALEKGLDIKPWVKTSLAPGSTVVTEYLQKAGLIEPLEKLKFHVVGYGCTTCIGNSGDLPPEIGEAVVNNNLTVGAVLSGNRNFEARIHPNIKMNFLASPMLVVAYAIAGRLDADIYTSPLGTGSDGKPVYLKDIWPSQKEIADMMIKVLHPEDFKTNYGKIFEGDQQWQDLPAPSGNIFKWDDKSTYIKEAPFFQNLPETPEAPKDIEGAKVLLKLGQSVTTDHISPAGSFMESSPAGSYLVSNGVERKAFNSYGSRRGNHEVMMRGTFANVRIKNQLASREGGYTTYLPTGDEMTVYDASLKYKESNTPLVVMAGKEYGSGSSRDWAAKGTALLGIKAVIAESYERIHRSNLVGMGVLPLQFTNGQSPESLGLDGTETYHISGISSGVTPGKVLQAKAAKADGSVVEFEVLARIDSAVEVEYYKHGGILQYVLRRFLDEQNSN